MFTTTTTTTTTTAAAAAAITQVMAVFISVYAMSLS
jgi:hypothetical protein